MKKLKLFLNYAGYCIANEKHALEGGENRNVKFNALFGLILHPEKGWILFDTGYSKRFYAVTQHFPNSLYARFTKVKVSSSDEIQAQLTHFGISASDIKHVVLSHFHADHIGGAKDFENAQFYCSKASYHQLIRTSSIFGVKRGILKGLLPENFNSRVSLIEDIAIRLDDDIFDTKYDLWGDESIFIYNLPGHASGQIGLLVETQRNSYFLISDACWYKESYEILRPANRIVRLFFHSWNAYISTLKRINAFNRKYPKTIIVPTHCNETTGKLVSNKYDIDAL